MVFLVTHVNIMYVTSVHNIPRKLYLDTSIIDFMLTLKMKSIDDESSYHWNSNNGKR